MSVVVVGSSNVDLVSFVDVMPKVGQTIHGNDFKQVYGGKGANQAIAASMCNDSKVDFITCVGDDLYGNELVTLYTQQYGFTSENVIQAKDISTGIAQIVVDGNGDNFIVLAAAANGLLSAEQIEQRKGSIESASIVLCQLEVPIETTIKAMQLGRAAGVTTVLNPAPAASELPSELLENVDILIPNETELEVLSGQSVTDTESATSAAIKLIKEFGTQTVIVTLGENGCLVVTENGDSVQKFSPPKIDNVVDTVGAGDAFVGTLVVKMAAGQDISACVKQAMAAASCSVQFVGAQGSYKMEEEWQSLME